MGHIHKARQQGAIMLMTMIIMLVMLFSGLFVMEMAIVEEMAVSNEQRRLQVYQVAYSELDGQYEYLVANSSVLLDATAADVPLTIIQNPSSCSDPTQVCQTATLRYIGEAPPPPGYSLGKFVGLMFEIDSVATLGTTGARSSQTLGFTYVTSL
ncbi:hypothetical protein [Endozoicomonas numazuensis]|uniref:Type 4 fimbrial biogenesis protein PilX N-terminal domain-containing protein n=1 Tax=Endozoicomonas numazuensis TaxID=1137799 RepID=A0A081N997_9GAMM|nr:hypothetical protein [Endozoicomonas numazuensis]KEQ15020.1 hypothetical protein GZ78_24370 [Endozoicomonas numazuensis]